MVFNLILSAFFGLINFVLGLLPTWNPPSFMTYEEWGVGHTVGALVYKLGVWVPTELVSDLLATFASLMEAAVYVAVVFFIYRMLPGKGT